MSLSHHGEGVENMDVFDWIYGLVITQEMGSFQTWRYLILSAHCHAHAPLDPEIEHISYKVMLWERVA